jgi:hypothetical protein
MADWPQRWSGHGNKTNSLTEDWNNGTKASDYDWDTKLMPNDTKIVQTNARFKQKYKLHNSTNWRNNHMQKPCPCIYKLQVLKKVKRTTNETIYICHI